jgi:hypothetical protein
MVLAGQKRNSRYSFPCGFVGAVNVEPMVFDGVDFRANATHRNLQ